MNEEDILRLSDENQRILDRLRSTIPGPEEVGPDRAAAWEQLSQAVADRLRIARHTYGERIPTMQPTKVLDEILCEVADICGWSVLLWHRLQALRKQTISLLPDSDSPSL